MFATTSSPMKTLNGLGTGLGMRRSSSSTSLCDQRGSPASTVPQSPAVQTNALPDLLSFVPLQNAMACGFPDFPDFPDEDFRPMVKSTSMPSFESLRYFAPTLRPNGTEKGIEDASCLVYPPEVVDECGAHSEYKRYEDPAFVNRLMRIRRSRRNQRSLPGAKDSPA